MKIRRDGNFTQDFQALHHSNTATPVTMFPNTNLNKLIDLKPKVSTWP